MGYSHGLAFQYREKEEALASEAGLEDSDLLFAGTLVEHRRGRPYLLERILRWLAPRGSTPPEPYRALAALPLRTVVSFHPDPWLERVLAAQQPPFRVMIDDEDLAAFRPGSGDRELFLLGGSAISGRGLVLTLSDHQHLRRRIEVLARGLRERLASQSLLLLGCDLSDLNLKDLYLEATRHLSNREPPVYVVGLQGPTPGPAAGQTVLALEPAELMAELVRFVPAAPRPAEPLTPPPKAVFGRRPYKYLDYFEAEDRDLFFGREEEIARFSGEILASPSRITVVCGRSGVGKTSLVKAGLIPQLKGSLRIVAIYCRFGSDPERSIALVMHHLPRLSQDLRFAGAERQYRRPAVGSRIHQATADADIFGAGKDRIEERPSPFLDPGLDLPGPGTVASAGELQVGLEIPAQAGDIVGGERQGQREGFRLLAVGLDPAGVQGVVSALDDETKAIG